MSHPLISHNSDLKRLRDEGFEVEIRSGLLLVGSVPYFTAKGVVEYGTLVSELTLAGDVTTAPATHLVYFTGDHPCQKDGTEIPQIRHGVEKKLLAEGLEVQRSFSNKPPGGYPDFYEKMARYAQVISAPVQSEHPSIRPQTFNVIDYVDEGSVFEYLDTASSRAGIGVLSRKLKVPKVGIVGLGGTGAYVLDLLAKTEPDEIHLYDGDVLLQHNAFRAPGAPSKDELRAKPMKVTYYRDLYSKMRRGIIPHEAFISPSNVHELAALDFVFVCVDKGSVKKLITDTLRAAGVGFIAVGMGAKMVDGALIAVLRVTTSTGRKNDHVPARIPQSDGDDDDYRQNIQIADLNCLNAALAVLKWKKLRTFYQDLEGEHHCTYTTNCNLLTSEEIP
ncbi:MAG: ThiF family adenylyltransferase [Rhodocyclaceae bacterium]|nr:MAG: ThiF family adenylyltransferase [Rhodocyclaceae bacterium]